MAVLAAAVTVGSCTTSTWDTSEIDNSVPSTAKRYGGDDAGVIGSMTAHLSAPIRDLNRWTAPEAEARCVAERLIERMTSRRLVEIGYDPQKPSLVLAYEPAERTAAINIVVGCIDLSQSILELMSSYQKLSIAASDCLAEGFDRLGLVRDMAGALIDGREPDPFANDNRFSLGIAKLAGECLADDELPPAGPLAPTPPGADLNTTTTTMPVGKDGSGGLEGIVPGGPLDTTGG